MQNAGDVLSGVTVEGLEQDRILLMTLDPLTKELIEQHLVQGRQGPTNLLRVYHHPSSAAGNSDQLQLQRCEELLHNADLEVPPSSRGLCFDAFRAIFQIKNGDAVVSLMREKEVGANRGALSVAVANFPSDLGRATYRIVGKIGMPMIRTLQLDHGHQTRLSLLLSPLGDVLGGRVRINETEPSANPNILLEQETIYFDHAFNVVQHTLGEFGHRDSLKDALQRWLEPSPFPAQILTDGSRSPLFAPISAMLLEYAIDLRYTNLASRFVLDAGAAVSYATTSKMPVSLFGPRTRDARKYLDVITDDPDRGALHGTMVASLLAADLPELKIGLVPLGNDSWLSDPQRAAQLIIDEIQSLAPKVVNISQGFIDDVADCEVVFGPVFSRFSDEVLFVTAAGNDASRNPADVCPASMASEFPNVINVAGVDTDGHLSYWSNYGSKTVHVAAPFCAQVLGDNDGKNVLHEQCGTSFAAPAVANAALRVLAQHPSLSPSDLKQLLMDSCKGDSLDVACGGAIDVNRLEELADKHETSASFEHPMHDSGSRPHPIENPK